MKTLYANTLAHVLSWGGHMIQPAYKELCVWVWPGMRETTLLAANFLFLNISPSHLWTALPLILSQRNRRGKSSGSKQDAAIHQGFSMETALYWVQTVGGIPWSFSLIRTQLIIHSKGPVHVLHEAH